MQSEKKLLVLTSVISLMCLAVLVESVSARGGNKKVFGRRQSSRQVNYNYTATSTGYVSSGDADEVALRKSQIQAEKGFCFHPGGSMGGLSYEGVGASSYSAQDALTNCCFSGQRTVAAEAVVRSSNGIWYATRLFH